MILKYWCVSWLIRFDGNDLQITMIIMMLAIMRFPTIYDGILSLHTRFPCKSRGISLPIFMVFCSLCFLCPLFMFFFRPFSGLLLLLLLRKGRRWWEWKWGWGRHWVSMCITLVNKWRYLLNNVLEVKCFYVPPGSVIDVEILTRLQIQ